MLNEKQHVFPMFIVFKSKLIRYQKDGCDKRYIIKYYWRTYFSPKMLVYTLKMVTVFIYAWLDLVVFFKGIFHDHDLRVSMKVNQSQVHWLMVIWSGVPEKGFLVGNEFPMKWLLCIKNFLFIFLKRQFLKSWRERSCSWV